MQQKTFIPKPTDIQRQLYLIDAKDKILGKVATRAATVLRGKHKRIFTPHVDCGDMVVVINAEKVRVSAKKTTTKIYDRYTGYPSGRRLLSFEQLMAKNPTEIIRLAVHGMIPHNKLGADVRERLKIYAGEKHPHQAQKPIALAV